MKIALTGATGHFGPSLIQELLLRGFKVKALARDTTKVPQPTEVEIVKGNIFSIDDLKKLMEGCDALIHSAALISIHGDPDGLVHKTNVESVALVLQAARESGIKRMVHISSIHAFQQQPTFEILDENRTKVDQKANAYDRSKLAGQNLVLKANSNDFETIIVNPTAMTGPPDPKPSLLGRAIIDLYNGKIPAVIKGGFDFCDTRDSAHAVVNALTMGTPGQNYLLGGKWYDMTSFVNMISKVSGKKVRVVSLPAVFAKAGLPFISLYARVSKEEPLYTNESLEALEFGNRKVSSDKAIRELHYKIRPFEETMHDTFHWFKDNGYLK